MLAIPTPASSPLLCTRLPRAPTASTSSADASPSLRRTVTHTTLLPPTPIVHASQRLQLSIHAPATRLLNDIAPVFPSIINTQSQARPFLVLPVMFPTVHDLVASGADVDRERDDVLEAFVAFGHELARRVRAKADACGAAGDDWWFDFTDPASGYPMLTAPGPSLYPDVHGAQALLRYDVMNVGCCKVLLHPTWGSKVYPATCFSTAPASVLVECIADLIVANE
ncbi:hypothetical protein BC828DRAFT_389870 [Blastocladiella britannica]|nr:hypothetical protein BC828DRAFT_389870 [Blastocladiella britannica]